MEIPKKYLEQLPPELHEYFKLWYKTFNERGERLGRYDFAELVGKSPNTVRRWIKKFKTVIGQADKSHDQIQHEQNIKLLQDQIQYWKRKYSKLLRRSSFEYAFIEAAKHLMQALPQSRPAQITGLPATKKRVRENLTLIISDLHAGEVVSSAETYGFNEYNSQIMLNRLSNLFGKMLDISQSKLIGYQFDILHIDLLGDMISGVIHDELIATGDLSIVEAILVTAVGLAYCISAVAPYFRKVHIHGVTGNHGRLTKQKQYKQAYANYDYLIYQLLKILLAKHDNIQFTFPKSWFLVYENNGYRVCMFHGDSIRTWAGVPWYGIQRAIAKLSKILAKKGLIIDIWEMGHFHQDANIPDDVLINGSIIGPSEYAMKAMHSISPAMQKMYGVHKDVGITFMYRLRPDKESKLKIKLPQELYNLTLDKDMLEILMK